MRDDSTAMPGHNGMKRPLTHAAAAAGDAAPTLASRTDLPARVRSLLDGVFEHCRTYFEPAVQRALDDTEQALFNLAERAGDSGQQQRCIEGVREIKHGRADVVPRFLQQLEARLAHLRGATPATTAAADGMPAPLAPVALELVDSAVLDEDLALREVASKSEVRNSQSLYALGHRLGVVAGTPAWTNDTLPIGPARIVDAFRQALVGLDLDVAQRVLAYRQFDRAAMLRIGTCYDAINAGLATARVLPNLKTPHGYRRASAPAAPAAAPAGESPQHGGGDGASNAAGAAAAVDDTELFKTLRNLLASRRQPDSAAVPPSSPRASSADVQTLLGALQRSSTQRAGAEYDSEHFRNVLHVKLRRASPLGQPLHLSDEDSDTVDLIGMLFDHITRDTSGDSGTRGLLTRLHVPVLRVALGDKTFFTRRDHPARELLNTIAETSSRWSDDSDADPDLARKMQLVVDRVSADFDGNPVVFEDLLTDLSAHMQLLARRADVVERRHVDAARGRDKLEIARRTAQTAITRVLGAGTPTPLVRALLEQAWADALALSALRDGERGPEFLRRLAVAEELVQRAAQPQPPPPDAALRDDLDAGLRQVGLHGEEVGGVLDHLFAPPGDGSVDFADNLRRVDELLKRKTRLGGETPEPTSKSPPLTPPEADMLARLLATPFGTWFEFVTNQQGATVRRKLAWFSTVTGRCLFVNQRGMRSEDRTLDQVARDMVRGQIRVEIPQPTSLIDRAWKAIMDVLRPTSDSSSAAVQA